MHGWFLPFLTPPRTENQEDVTKDVGTSTGTMNLFKSLDKRCKTKRCSTLLITDWMSGYRQTIRDYAFRIYAKSGSVANDYASTVLNRVSTFRVNSFAIISHRPMSETDGLLLCRFKGFGLSQGLSVLRGKLSCDKLWRSFDVKERKERKV